MTTIEADRCGARLAMRDVARLTQTNTDLRDELRKRENGGVTHTKAIRLVEKCEEAMFLVVYRYLRTF
jgi:hypothetical protein